MDKDETIVEHSDYQYLDNDDLKSIKLPDYHNPNYFFNKDDYSDIYYDRNYINEENVSQWGISNYPKEINLDATSTVNIPNFKYRGRRLSRGIIMEPPDFDTHLAPSEANAVIDDEGLSRYENEHWRHREEHKDDESCYYHSNSSSQNQAIPGELSNENSSHQSFNKNEAKLVFKVTRINRATLKEKLITKNRRIISKWPHTTMKYYAKGMWKKWYHNYGREKKANVCQHTDKPLYAKGYCKQWYLSKYKEKMYSVGCISSINRRSKKSSLNIKCESIKEEYTNSSIAHYPEKLSEWTDNFQRLL